MSEEEKLQLENECLLKHSKAQMIKKYIDELEENCTLSDLWCKSQEENKRLNNIIKNTIEELFELKDMIYKPETREINFDVQRKISSMIVKLGSDTE